MKICCVSDLHGNLIDIPSCDLLIIAGDISPNIFHQISFQKDWFHQDFLDWAWEIPAPKIVLIPGNHDFYFENEFKKSPEDNYFRIFKGQNKDLICLINYGFEIDELKIWGTPWALPFFDWAFYKEEDELREVYSKIPDNTDIIVSHGPPFGCCDLTIRGEHVGSKALLETIHRVNPKTVVTGHIHWSYGLTRYNETDIINCSILNESYQVSNKPFILEI